MDLTEKVSKVGDCVTVKGSDIKRVLVLSGFGIAAAWYAIVREEMKKEITLSE